MNVYAYVVSSPFNLIDPYGLEGVSWFETLKLIVTNEDVRDSFYDGAKDGGMSTIDGIIPFSDPFAERGMYDPCDPLLKVSKLMGQVIQEAIMAPLPIPGPGALRLINLKKIMPGGGIQLLAKLPGGGGKFMTSVGGNGFPYPKPSLTQSKNALREVYKRLGGKIKGPKIKGKKTPGGMPGSSGRGTTNKGFRFEPDGNPPGWNHRDGKAPHVDYWDYTNGKRGRGGVDDSFPIN